MSSKTLLAFGVSVFMAFSASRSSAQSFTIDRVSGTLLLSGSNANGSTIDKPPFSKRWLLDGFGFPDVAASDAKFVIDTSNLDFDVLLVNKQTTSTVYGTVFHFPGNSGINLTSSRELAFGGPVTMLNDKLSGTGTFSFKRNGKVTATLISFGSLSGTDAIFRGGFKATASGP